MSRVRCEACREWMFHAAKTCPHCGAVRGAAADEAPAAEPAKARKPLKLTPEEARALLTVDAVARGPSDPSPEQGLADTVLWRDSPLDKALTVLAFPVTVLAVICIGLALTKARRWGAKVTWEQARWLAVPTMASLGWVAASAAGSSTGATVAVGTSLGAYFVRALLRRRRSPAAELEKMP